jgi:predicted branched-subunit amino acid permease
MEMNRSRIKQYGNWKEVFIMSINTLFFCIWIVGSAAGTILQIIGACTDDFTQPTYWIALPWGDIWMVVWGAIWFACFRIIPKKIFGELNILD